MIKVAIMGATGYSGIELVRLLSQHNNVEIKYLISKTFSGQKISNIYPNLKCVLDEVCQEMNIDYIVRDCDLVFTALPHGVSKTIVPKLINNNLKVIDLSGDFRYKDVKVYEKWYQTKHEHLDLLESSVYGLPELHRKEISQTSLVGNPGCYTTCAILALAPLLANNIISTDNILIDAKSGVSGAGRKLSLNSHFCEATENTKAYSIGTHRHTSEIEQELSIIANEDILISFTPHLVPMKRGILSTAYANLNNTYSANELIDLFKDFYKDDFFVRIYDKGTLPETKNVTGSNFIDIGLSVDSRLNRLVVVSALDNLIKGAAGQAVQNMNIMFNLNEASGLTSPGLYI